MLLTRQDRNSVAYSINVFIGEDGFEFSYPHRVFLRKRLGRLYDSTFRFEIMGWVERIPLGFT